MFVPPRKGRWPAILAMLTLVGCGPPQLGGAAGVEAVMALRTAVYSRRPDLVSQCESRLAGLRQDAKISTGAHDALQQIIAVARQGDWERAQTRITAFQKGQRPSR